MSARRHALVVMPLACVAFVLAMPRTMAQTPGRDARAASSTALSASLTGVVTSGDEANTPLKRVTVALAAGPLQMPYIALTNDAGVFTFGGVPAGTYTLSATKPAYVPAFYGAKRPGRGPGVPIAILEGQKVTGISLRMLRGGVITGTLRQPSGFPAVGGSSDGQRAKGALSYRAGRHRRSRRLPVLRPGARALQGHGPACRDGLVD